MSYTTGFQAPPLSRTNKVILALLALSFIIYSLSINIFHVSLDLYLGLHWSTFKSGFIWQLVTYPFVTHGIMEFLFNGLLIWFLGYDLEYRWGRRNYLLFFGVTILANAILFLGWGAVLGGGYPLTGLAGICSALLIAYAIIYPEREFAFMLIFPIKAKYFVALLLAIELFFAVGGNNSTGALAQISTWFVSSMFVIFVLKESLPQKLRFFVKKTPPSRRSSHLHIVKNDASQTEKREPRYWQ